MPLSRREIALDVLQQSAEAAITSAGHVTAIVFESVRKISEELGAFGSEMFEIAESGRRANDDLPTKPHEA